MKHLTIATALVLASTLAHATIKATSTPAELAVELRQEANNGKSLAAMVEHALAAGVDAQVLVSTLVQMGYDRKTVVASAIKAGVDPQLLMDAPASQALVLVPLRSPASSFAGGGRAAVSPN